MGAVITMRTAVCDCGDAEIAGASGTVATGVAGAGVVGAGAAGVGVAAAGAVGDPPDGTVPVGSGVVAAPLALAATSLTLPQPVKVVAAVRDAAWRNSRLFIRFFPAP